MIAFCFSEYKWPIFWQLHQPQMLHQRQVLMGHLCQNLCGGHLV